MTLHPQAVAALELWSVAPRVIDSGLGQADIDAWRAEQRVAAALEPREDVDRVEDVDADGVQCRFYAPRGARRVLLFLHGGGFVFGDLDTHDAQSRRLANRTGSAVLTVDYRRPPEHPFPAAPDDVDVALSWLRAHADFLGLDPGRLVAVGDSAGGNLALVAALRNPGAFAGCVLVYPFVDAAMTGSSYAATDGGMRRDEAAWYWRQYAGDDTVLGDPDLDLDLAPFGSPLLGTVPPTLVHVAEHDVLVDENLELSRRMAKAGASVQMTTYPGMIHGFWRHPDLFDASEQALAETREYLDRHV